MQAGRLTRASRKDELSERRAPFRSFVYRLFETRDIAFVNELKLNRSAASGRTSELRAERKQARLDSTENSITP
jgi:hypothetical protein